MAISIGRRTLVFTITGLLLLAILVCIWILRFEFRAQAPLAVAARTARSSAPIQRLLGNQIHVSKVVTGDLISSGGYGNADLKIKIRGPLGEGTLYDWTQEEHGRWFICSLNFKSSDGSNAMSLKDYDAAHCERE